MDKIKSISKGTKSIVDFEWRFVGNFVCNDSFDSKLKTSQSLIVFYSNKICSQGL